MIITPQGKLILCSNIPMTAEHTDTRLFNSLGEQQAYFQSHAKVPPIEEYSVIKFGEVLRVPYEQDKISDCNYLCFQNANFSSKWFYAFITNIEYVNVNMCHVSYVIDVIQTYMFDWVLGSSYIERSHTPTDLIGGNLVADDFQVNEVINNDIEFISYGLNHVGMYYVDNSTQGGQVINDIFSGYEFIESPVALPIRINDKLKELNKEGYADRIGSIFMFPEICNSNDIYTTITVPDNLNGYIPKNKKLFSYPYCYVKADDGQGSTGEFYFEYSYEANKALQFTTVGKLATQPCVMTYVNEYNANAKDYENAIFTANFPICSYALDGYQNYISQNKQVLAAQAGSAALGVVASGVSLLANPSNLALGALGVTGSLMSATSMFARLSDKESVKNEGRGQALSDGMRMAIHQCGITFYTKCVPQYLAKIIDNRFSVFGYPIKAIETPNINSRPSWNYIKTQKLNVKGNIGMSALEEIRKIFDNGITFWHTDDIGNYDLPNEV